MQTSWRRFRTLNWQYTATPAAEQGFCAALSVRLGIRESWGIRPDGNGIKAEKKGLPEGGPFRSTCRASGHRERGRGAPQLYPPPAHCHAGNLPRTVPVVGSIAPSGRQPFGRWPGLAIPTRTVPRLLNVPFEMGTIHEVSFVGGFTRTPVVDDDKEREKSGQGVRSVKMKIVLLTIQYIVQTGPKPQPIVYAKFPHCR